jgi:single-strand DNA-binding protein
VWAFKTLAANIAESLGKGDRVFIHCTVTTDAWTDKDTGDKRTAQRALAEIVGPSLRWATPCITKSTR